MPKPIIMIYINITKFFTKQLTWKRSKHNWNVSGLKDVIFLQTNLKIFFYQNDQYVVVKNQDLLRNKKQKEY